MSNSLFDIINKLSLKYECFHLMSPNIDLMGQNPLYAVDHEKTTNELMWVMSINNNRIRLMHCMSSIEPNHYDEILILLPLDGYPPDAPDYTLEVIDGIEYEDAELLIVRHKNTGEEVVRIEFFS